MSKKMLIKTLTALAMIAVVVPCIIAGNIPLNILLLAIAALAAHETASLGTQKAHPAMTVLNFVFLAAMMFASRQYYESIIAIYLVILFTIELAFESINTDYVAYTFLLMYLTSIAISCVVYLYTAYPQSAMWYLLYIAFACFGCDTGAYFIGVFFGKHKMIPRISPNKTWDVCAADQQTAAGLPSAVCADSCRKPADAADGTDRRSELFIRKKKIRNQGFRKSVPGTRRCA